MSQNTSGITIICGHYGCGKTNLCLNLALRAAKNGPVTVVDMDIVNPYFRSSEYRGLLKDRSVRLITPVFAGTTLDTPSLPADIFSIFGGEGRVFIDAGGDDAGVTALGGLSPRLGQTGYEMIYVINRYRALSGTPEAAAELLWEIEAASRLKATGIVNNSHLGTETRLEDLLAAEGYAKQTSRLTGLPLLYSTAPDFALAGGQPPAGFVRIERLVRFAWE